MAFSLLQLAQNLHADLKCFAGLRGFLPCHRPLSKAAQLCTDGVSTQTCGVSHGMGSGYDLSRSLRKSSISVRVDMPVVEW